MGLATKLLQQTIEEAGKKNYKIVMADATNVISQHVLDKLGFETKGIVDYKSFVYDNKTPFASITCTDDIRRMILSLNHEEIDLAELSVLSSFG
jgi:RimJ/RimL family protein N-acetyltransferase